MMGPTHKQYSVCFAFLTAMLFYKLGITEINYYLAIPILILTAKYGARFPDVDHNWKNVSEKNVPNKIINVIIHATGGKHRSWQTHSIDICVIYTIIAFNLPRILFTMGYLTQVNREVMSILMLGFASGWLSHIFSDMLNGVGVRLVCWSKFTVAFVPKQLFGLRFNTGNEWEAFNYKVIRIIDVCLGVICLIYPLILNGYISNLLTSIGLI